MVTGFGTKRAARLISALELLVEQQLQHHIHMHTNVII